MSIRNRFDDALPEIKFDGDDIPVWNNISYKRRKKLANFVVFLGGFVGIFVIIAPLYWMWRTAFLSPNEVYSTPTPLLPTDLSLRNFVLIFTEGLFPTWYINSILYSLGLVIVTTVIATLAGYGLTRIDIPGKKNFARVILFGYMFPPILLAIPMFIFWRQIGLINSLVGLVFAQAAVSLPFSIWLMWKFFQTVPFSLEESAYVSGASRFRALYEIAIPLAKPGMVAIAVFTYAIAWNAFTIPNVLLVNSNKWVLTLGLYSYTTQNQVIWGQLMAASAMTVIPSFLFVYFLQTYLLRGFRVGGIG